MNIATASSAGLPRAAPQARAMHQLLLQEFCMSLFKKILVPIDGSDTADKAMRMALDMARESLASVRFLHVFDHAPDFNGYALSGDLRSHAFDHAKNLLQNAMDAASALGVNADTQLINQPGQRLGENVADAVENWGADLVVVGSHGRRGLGRLLLGSGAEQVMRLSPVPVLMVRGA
jgi:nucleotide-binding universal stress UspA family protein